MKYSKQRNYRDQIIVEEVTTVKKIIKKKPKESLFKRLIKKLTN
jgi:hypothetical protein